MLISATRENSLNKWKMSSFAEIYMMRGLNKAVKSEDRNNGFPASRGKG